VKVALDPPSLGIRGPDQPEPRRGERPVGLAPLVVEPCSFDVHHRDGGRRLDKRGLIAQLGVVPDERRRREEESDTRA
jgi:hypothetical protein